MIVYCHWLLAVKSCSSTHWPICCMILVNTLQLESCWSSYFKKNTLEQTAMVIFKQLISENIGAATSCYGKYPHMKKELLKDQIWEGSV